MRVSCQIREVYFMDRPTYITNDFYKAVQRESKQYSKNYEAIIERTRVLNELQKRLDCRDEINYNLLNNFGAM